MLKDAQAAGEALGKAVGEKSTCTKEELWVSALLRKNIWVRS